MNAMNSITNIETFIEWLMARIKAGSATVRDYADLEEELEGYIWELTEYSIVRTDHDFADWLIRSKMRVAKRPRREMASGIANLSTNVLMYLSRHGVMRLADFLEMALKQADLYGFVVVTETTDGTSVRLRQDLESVFNLVVAVDVPAPEPEEAVDLD